MAARFQGEERSLPAGRPREGKASGRRWEQNEALKGGQISLGGGGTFQAGTGVGWSKVGFGDGDWPGGLERRVI